MLKNKHGGNIREVSEKYNIKEEKIIDFSSNVNPYGIHKKIKKSIIKNINKISKYPDIVYKKLKHNISRYYDVPAKNILPGNGSVSLIYSVVRTLKIDKSLIVQPNFTEYESALKSVKNKPDNIIGVEKNNFKIPVKEIISRIKKDMVVFISNPNNPSGYLYSKKELKEILNYCEKLKSYLFIDEAFLDFYKSCNKITMINLLKNYNYLIILKSFTKSYAVPGLRLGCACASKNIIDKISDASPPWSINIFAEHVMDSILKLKRHFFTVSLKIKKEKSFLMEKLNNIPQLKIFNSNANYILCKLLKKKSVKRLEEYLGKNGIMIRNCSNYTGLDNNFFRIAVLKRNENKVLVKLLEKYF